MNRIIKELILFWEDLKNSWKCYCGEDLGCGKFICSYCQKRDSNSQTENKFDIGEKMSILEWYFITGVVLYVIFALANLKGFLKHKIKYHLKGNIGNFNMALSYCGSSL